MPPRTRRPATRARLLAATIAVATASVTAACGGSHDAAKAAASCPTTPGITNQQVKLGLIYPNTGTSASLFEPYRAGLDARLGVENAKGGVNGRQIVYDWQDDATDLETNLAAAESLVDQDHVFGIMESTSVATGSAAWLHTRQIPVVGTSIELAWSQYKNMFSYSNFVTSGPSISSWGEYVKAHGGTKVALLYSGFNQTSRLFAQKFQTSMRAAGLPIVAMLNQEPTSINYNDVARQIRDSGADALVGATDPTMFVTTAATAAPSLTVMLTSAGYDQQVLTAAGQLLKGRFSVFLDYSPFELNLPADREFLAAMASYSPQLQPQASEVALEGWVSGDLFLAGLKAAGPCVTRASYMKALRGLKNFNAGGILPRPVDMRATFGKPQTCYTFVQMNEAGNGWNVGNPHPLCGQLLSNPS